MTSRHRSFAPSAQPTTSGTSRQQPSRPTHLSISQGHSANQSTKLTEWKRAADKEHDEYLETVHAQDGWRESGRRRARIPPNLSRLEDLFDRMGEDWAGERGEWIMECAERRDIPTRVQLAVLSLPAEEFIETEDESDSLEEEESEEEWILLDVFNDKIDSSRNRIIERDLNNNGNMEDDAASSPSPTPASTPSPNESLPANRVSIRHANRPSTMRRLISRTAESGPTSTSGKDHRSNQTRERIGIGAKILSTSSPSPSTSTHNGEGDKPLVRKSLIVVEAEPPNDKVGTGSGEGAESGWALEELQSRHATATVPRGATLSAWRTHPRRKSSSSRLTRSQLLSPIEVIPEEDEEEDDDERAEVNPATSATGVRRAASMFQIHTAVPCRVVNHQSVHFASDYNLEIGSTMANEYAKNEMAPLSRYSSTDSDDTSGSEAEGDLNGLYFVTNPAFEGQVIAESHDTTNNTKSTSHHSRKYQRHKVQNGRQKMRRSRSLKSLYGFENCHNNPLYDPPIGTSTSSNNTGSSGNGSSQRQRPVRAPPRRRAAVPDRVDDDLAVRKVRHGAQPVKKYTSPSVSYMAASPLYSNDDPLVIGSVSNLTTRISPLSVVSPLSSTRSLLTSGYGSVSGSRQSQLEGSTTAPSGRTSITTPLSNEPDLVRDDLLVRSIVQSSGAQIPDPDPPFGIPRQGHIAAGSVTPSHYVHAEIYPEEMDRVRCPGYFSKPTQPHLVRDDVAFRKLRSDINKSTYTPINDNENEAACGPPRPQSPERHVHRSLSPDSSRRRSRSSHASCSDLTKSQDRASDRHKTKSRSQSRSSSLNRLNSKVDDNPVLVGNLSHLDGFYDPKTGLVRFPQDKTLEELVAQYRATCAFDTEESGDDTATIDRKMGHSEVGTINDDNCILEKQPIPDEGPVNPFKRMLANSFLDRGATLQRSDSFIYIKGTQGGTLPSSTVTANNDRPSNPTAPTDASFLYPQSPAGSKTVYEQLQENSARRIKSTASIKLGGPDLGIASHNFGAEVTQRSKDESAAANGSNRVSSNANVVMDSLAHMVSSTANHLLHMRKAMSQAVHPTSSPSSPALSRTAFQSHATRCLVTDL